MFYTTADMNRTAPGSDKGTILSGKTIERPPHGVSFNKVPEATGKAKKTEFGL